MKKVFIVHSTAGSQGLFSVMSSMYTTNFTKKVVWVERLVEVMQSLQMPMATALKCVNGPHDI